MSATSTEAASRGTNPLYLPMVIVSILAVAEAVALVILLARQGPSPAPPIVTAPGMTSGGAAARSERGSAGTRPAGAAEIPAAGAARPATAEMARGKRGERVESATGFAITVEKIVYEPAYDVLREARAGGRYLALLLLVENNTGGNVGFYPALFRLQDDQAYEYEPLAMKLMTPALEWRTLGNRDKVRGYVDFIVPKTAKGLTLIYTPIHVDLAE